MLYIQTHENHYLLNSKSKYNINSNFKMTKNKRLRMTLLKKTENCENNESLYFSRFAALDTPKYAYNFTKFYNTETCI